MSEPAKSAEAQDPVQELYELWSRGQRPDVREFVARAGAEDVAQLAAVVQIDQRGRWENGERIPAETYMAWFPALRQDRNCAIDLVYAEFLLREDLQEKPAISEYRLRFPEYSEELQSQVELHRALESKSFLFRPNSTAHGALDRQTQHASLEPIAESSSAAGADTKFPSLPGYEILGELGRGGMGVVYKARQLGLNRLVALKMILLGDHTTSDQLSRFRAEAEIVAGLQHPNIVQVYEIGAHGRRPYFSLEYVDGGTLADKQISAPLPPRQAAELIEALARAMHYAHQCGIVHRDLKPGNILLSIGNDSGVRLATDNLQLTTVPKITDFGLAKHLEAGGMHTQTGAILGTPGYMAPEQAGGNTRDVTPAVDIYALGAILYQLLVGRPPFQAASILETLELVRSADPVPPRHLQPKLPGNLETICLKCLQKDRNKRYASAGELADDLRRFLLGQPIKARRTGTVERVWRWCRRNPGWAAMLAALATLVLVIVIGTTLGMTQLQSTLETSEGNLKRATEAERDVQMRFFDALLQQARSNHRSRRSGQRFATLRLVDEAAGLGKKINAPPDKLDELRNVAIGALAMPDLYPAYKWERASPGTFYISFASNLDVYARADEKGDCFICRHEQGKEKILHQIAGAEARPSCILSPDARFVAVRSENGHMNLWQIDASKPVLRMENTQVHHVHFHPDGRHVMVTYRHGPIVHYDLQTGRKKVLRSDVIAEFPEACMHPTQPLVAIWSYHYPVVELRDLDTGALRLSLRLPNQQKGTTRPFSCAWHPDGRTLAMAAEDSRIRLFDTTTGRLLRHFGPSGGGAVIVFNHAGDRMVEVDFWSGHAALWDTITGRRLLHLPPGLFFGLPRFSPDDRLLAGGIDGGSLHIWQVGDAREYRTLQRHMLPFGNYYGFAAIHPRGRLIAVGMTDGIGLWDVETGEELRFLASGITYDLLFEPLIEGEKGVGKEGALLIADNTGVRRLPIEADPKHPAGFRVGASQKLHSAVGGALSQSADGQTVALAARAVSLHEPHSGLWIWRADRPQEAVRCAAGHDLGQVAVSPDGRWVVAGAHANDVIQIWDAAAKKMVKVIRGRGTITRFSPDGRWLAAHTGRLWKVGPTIDDWSETSPAGASDGRIAFSPNSRLLALQTNAGAIRLYDLVAGHDIAILEDPELQKCHLAFTPDNTRLIAVDTVDGVHVWDLRRIRDSLSTMGQDWKTPSYPPANALARKPAQTDRAHTDVLPTHPLLLAGEVVRLTKELMLSPGNPDLYFRRGQAFARLGRDIEAQADIQQCLALRPDHSAAHFHNGGKAMSECRWPDAVRHFTTAAGDPAWRLTAHVYRSVVRLHQGLHSLAEKDRNLVSAVYPDFTNAFFWYGEQHRQQGERALATAFFEASLYFQPESPAVSNQVAWVRIMDSGAWRDLARGLALAERAVKAVPNHPHYLNTLGVAQFRLGKHAEALASLERALALRKGDSAYDLFFLSMCHCQLGDLDKATECYDRALNCLPEGNAFSAITDRELASIRAEAEAMLRAVGRKRAAGS